MATTYGIFKWVIEVRGVKTMREKEKCICLTYVFTDRVSHNIVWARNSLWWTFKLVV